VDELRRQLAGALLARTATNAGRLPWQRTEAVSRAFDPQVRTDSAQVQCFVTARAFPLPTEGLLRFVPGTRTAHTPPHTHTGALTTAHATQRRSSAVWWRKR
jgi:hypothetical protein